MTQVMKQVLFSLNFNNTEKHTCPLLIGYS